MEEKKTGYSLEGIKWNRLIPIVSASACLLSACSLFAQTPLSAKSLFAVQDLDDEPLLKIINDEELNQDLYSLLDTLYAKEDDPALSFIELDELDEPAMPWDSNEVAKDEITTFLEKETKKLMNEIDDPFGYELNEKRSSQTPSVEKRADALLEVQETTNPKQAKSDEAFAKYLQEEERQAVNSNFSMSQEGKEELKKQSKAMRRREAREIAHQPEEIAPAVELKSQKVATQDHSAKWQQYKTKMMAEFSTFLDQQEKQFYLLASQNSFEEAIKPEKTTATPKKRSFKHRRR